MRTAASACQLPRRSFASSVGGCIFPLRVRLAALQYLHIAAKIGFTYNFELSSRLRFD